MSMLISSLKRRNEALQNECDSLAGGIDHLSQQINEAYSLLKKYEPEYVENKLNPQPQAPVEVATVAETPAAEAEPVKH